METSIVAVEENHQRSDSSSLVSKPSGSVVKNIDSIYIDLHFPMEKMDAEKCQHFSIRRYVAEMRVKDRRMCSLLPSDENTPSTSDNQYVLPPLDVPKFRWWLCQSCLRQIGTTSSLEEIGVISRCCEGCISSMSCSNIQSNGDVAMMPSDSQMDKIKEREVAVNAPSNLNGDGKYLSACITEKEKNAEAGHSTYAVHEHGSGDGTDKGIGITSSDVIKLNMGPIQERHTHGKDIVKASNYGLVNILEPNCGSQDAAIIVCHSEYPSYPCSSSAAICPVKNQNSADDIQMNELTDSETMKEGSNIAVVSGKAVRVPSGELERHDDGSSESDELLPGYRQCDSTNGFPRQKLRKVRLLSELLGTNAEKNNIKTSGASSRGLTTSSVGLASRFAPPGRVALHEKAGKVSRDLQRKRKMTLDPDQKSLNVGSPHNIAKKFKALSREADTTAITIEQGSPKSPTLEEQSIEPTYSPPIMPLQEVVPNMNRIRFGDTSKYAAAHASFCIPKQDVYLGRRKEPSFRSSLSPGKIERMSILSNKKKKMPQIEDRQFSLMPQSNSLFGEGSSIKRKDMGVLPACPEITKQKPANNMSANMGLDLTLSSYMSAQRNEKNCPLLPEQKSIPGQDREGRHDICVGESRILHKTAPTPSLREDLLWDLNKRIAHRTAMPCDRQNGSPLLEDRFSPHQRMDFSGSCSNGKSFEVEKNSEVAKKHNDQRGDKMFEEGTSDEIPMEIVELMAKNQYERGLYEMERNYCPSERTTNDRNVDIRGFSELSGNVIYRSLQKDHPMMGRSPSGNARTGIIRTAENPGVTRRSIGNFSHVNGSPFNISQPEENLAFTMRSAFLQSQQKQLNGIQVSASASFGDATAQNRQLYGAQNRQLYGDKMVRRTSPAEVQVLEAYKTCNTGSCESKEAEHIWSSQTPNQMVFGQNVSQKSATQSSKVDKHAQSPGTLKEGKVIRDLDLNFVDLHAANREKLNENVDSESSKRTSAEYPFFPEHRGLELYPKATLSLHPPPTSEAIPAMQLLSLMDGAPFNLDPKKLVEKPFSPCDYHPKFSVDGKRNFLEKSFFPCHHSREFNVLGPGVHNTHPSSSHPGFAPYSRNHLSDVSRECSAAVPTVNPFATTPSQYHGHFRSAASTPGQMSIKRREHVKEKRPYPITEHRGRRLQKSSNAGGLSQTVRQSFSVQDKQKGITGASNPMVLHTLENSTKCIDLGQHSMPGHLEPLKSASSDEICTLNRNPADFSIPAAGNPYMIRGQYLKFGKNTHSGDRSISIDMDKRKKRQKLTKLTTAKEHAQHHTT